MCFDVKKTFKINVETYNKTVQQKDKVKIIEVFINADVFLYRIMAVMKVETDIITSIAVRPIGQPVILLILYVCQDLQN